MDKAFVDKWVAALRSGEHKQGPGTLHDAVNDSKCCLGVACVVAKLEPVYIEYENHSLYSYYDSERTLNGTVRNILKIRTSTGRLVLTQKEKDYLGRKYNLEIDFNSLSNLNDAGVSFEDIADIIEAHYQEL